MSADRKVEVGEMQVRGVKYTVSVNVDAASSWRVQGGAQFSMTVSGKEIIAPTWEDLYKVAMRASKQAAVKVAVPLLQFKRERYGNRDPHLIPVTLTGQHQGTSNYLISRNINGKVVSEQTDSYSRGQFFMPMSVEEQARGLALHTAMEKADEAWRKWDSAHTADLHKLYEAAEAEAMERLDREEGR